ncbi:hypothetical protein C8035_v006275 [Colletotrichum spinosum]|uniref:Uncharacterized protein n=1 Tax=Colletotrichum spinosum TaxID=1347390 RepID=A0A4R8QWN1_9PEZI|nr:hypothetical protein C8035_v006275 [Colletotrichum spinosum]
MPQDATRNLYQKAFGPMSIKVAVVALIWDIAELVTICARGGRRGIHPGAQVGVHLVLWLAFAAAAGVESITIYFRDSYDSYTSYSGSRVAFVNKIIAMQNTVLALTSLLLIGHFIIFVRACMETSQRNKRPPILMVPVSVPGPMAEESYAPYPHPPQQAYMSPQAEKGHMSGAQPPNMGSYTPPGADGTYYGPGQAR